MPFEILESEQGKPFKFKGIAMIKDSISGNGRRYSAELVENVVNTVKNMIKSNGSYPLTVMADHPNTTSTNKTLTTVGKITDMYIEGNNAIIEAEIANTTYGKDVQELIRGKFVEGLSIRASNAKSRKLNINGRIVNDILEMELKGVDLVTNPGVKGARVLDILESDNSGVYVSIEEEINTDVNIEEEVELDYSKIVLEEFKNKRPDLVEKIKQEFKPIFESEFNVNSLQESLNTLEAEKQSLEESLDAIKSEKETLESELEAAKNSLEEAQNELNSIKESEAKAKREAYIAEELGKLKFADSIKEKLKKKVEVLESIEEIESTLKEEVEFLETVIKESTGVNISGFGHTGSNGGNEDIDEDEDFIKMVESL